MKQAAFAPNARYLIVNADDFGQSPGVNRGIVQAHERGIVTSASLMTRWPAARAASDYARAHPDFGMGLHVDLGEYVFRDGTWQVLYKVADLNDPLNVDAEVRRQLTAFRKLVGREPDHIDSHQHVHREGPAHVACSAVASELGIPLRHFSSVRYCGNFYGQGETGESYPELVGVEAICRILSELPAGAAELCCHPAAGADLDTMYVHEREIELKTLCDPAVRRALDRADIQLSTFAGLGEIDDQLKPTIEHAGREGGGP